MLSLFPSKVGLCSPSSPEIKSPFPPIPYNPWGTKLYLKRYQLKNKLVKCKCAYFYKKPVLPIGPFLIYSKSLWPAPVTLYLALWHNFMYLDTSNMYLPFINVHCFSFTRRTYYTRWFPAVIHSLWNMHQAPLIWCYLIAVYFTMR